MADHNLDLALYLIEILHQTTTACWVLISYARCILLKFYIKPQHAVERVDRVRRCILLKFYIKPQPQAEKSNLSSSCILLKFYIKPQLRRG